MSETLTETLPDPLDGIEEGDEPAILQLPLDAWHRARGGRMVPFAGYEMPVQYEGIMAEHLWVRESAGLFDVSHMGQVTLTGDGLDAAGVARALEAVLPGDIAGLAPTKIRYSLLLNDEGEGWFFKITLSDPSELDTLMDETAYEAFVAKL